MTVDEEIRRLFPAGPVNAPSASLVTLAVIEVIGGFEAFNTRPYHNYETWGQGYRVTAQGITVEAEYLEEALQQWKRKAADILVRPA